MRLPIRVWAGLYGLAVHVVVLVASLWNVRSADQLPAGFWITMALPFFAAAFVVYALLVGSYVPKRPSHRGAVFFDSAVGMFAELGVVVVTAVLYAFVSSTGAMSEGFSAYLGAVANNTLFGFLWAVGSFFMQILIVGNAAGFVGWWVMKRVNARKAAAPQG
jgi:ABC-type sulfate transport system permease component